MFASTIIIEIMETLSDREKLIFQSIVESFISTAAPVGSRFLSKKYKISLSPATIRNVMTDLEEKGLILQPHTSAGRVPTDKGYRQYVDSLSDFYNHDVEDAKLIIERLSLYFEDVNDLLEGASHILGEISDLLGVVMAPRFFQGSFYRIELIRISEKRLLAVIHIKSGLVRTIIMELQSEISPYLLEKTQQILNERLSGLTIEEIKKTFDARFRDIASEDAILLNLLAQSRERLFTFEEKNAFHVAGAKNIVKNPEFADAEAMRKILELMENREIIINLLTEKRQSDRVTITIGEENREDLVKSCSLITAQYDVGNRQGTVGVIGPTRMQYEKVIALVDFMSKTLEYILNNKAQ